MKKYIFLFLLSIINLIYTPSFCDYKVETIVSDTQDIRTNGKNTIEGDNKEYLLLSEKINKYLWFFMGTVSLVVVIYAGFLLMSSNGNPEDLKKGNNMLIWGLIGIFVSIFAYLIIKLLIGLF